MNCDDRVYTRLQRHLDRQAVGFPATRSGAEIRILKHIFTPREAALACCLSYRFDPLETILERSGDLIESLQALETLLDRIQAKGGIEVKIKHGKKYYGNAPLVVGIYEFQLGRLTPEFIRDFNSYTSDIRFGIDFLSTELPQMRTIPVTRSIHPQHRVSTFDEAAALLEDANGPFFVVECICRKKKSLEGAACQVTDRKETCLAIGDIAHSLRQGGVGREISRSEAISIVEHNQKEGLVLQPSNTQRADFICSCCGCCCGMLRMHQRIPKPLDFWVSNFQAAVDAATCTCCGLCAKRCQVGAVTVSAPKKRVVVNLSRCIGCGVCVPTCPTGSISLVKKPTEVMPPKTRQDLYDVIMAHKKGRLGKLKLAGKLIADAVRTGQTHLLKPPSE